MAYTHYWHVKWVDILKKKLMLSNLKNVLDDFNDIIQFENDDDNPPLLNENQIRFNGKDNEGYETFCFPFKLNDGFCKTGRNPYDTPVCICLLILKAHFGISMSLSSDGFGYKLDDDWTYPISYVKKLGYDVSFIDSEIEVNIKK